MCGILGIIRKEPIGLPDRWMLRRMADALIRRGPDGEGFHLASNVGIGMRRLAIIDPRGGWQPLYNEDHSVVVVANGEIYNFIELRKDLEARGHVFRTGSDCETIVHLYEEYGASLVDRLRGMFAFALIDERRSQMLIARDRLGEKPLLLAETQDCIVFASELAALVAGGAVPLEIDADAIKSYYYWGFIPEPMCAVRGVRKLPAGSMLEIDLAGWHVSERVYWRLEDAPPIDDDPVERVRQEIATVGRLTNRSDVPIGVGLSSGIDSSAVAALAVRYADQPVEAFTIGYPGRAWQDESHLAADFARQLGIPCHRLELRTDDVVDSFPRMCMLRDEPFVDIAGSALFALMQFVRDHGVRVLLSGLGGDELFWGYGWHRDALVSSQRKRALLTGKAGLMDYLEVRMPPRSLVGTVNWAEDGAGLLAGIRSLQRDRATCADRLVFWDLVRDFRVAERKFSAFAGEAIRNSTRSPAEPFTGEHYWDDLEVSLTERLCATYLRTNGLAQCDRLSMSCSVEARVPLVDYRLAEVVVGLRKTRRDSGLGHKLLLRKALEGVLPQQVLERRKRGFSPPWRDWISCLFKRYAIDLDGGTLVTRGVLAESAAASLSRGFDWARRIQPFALESLVLEQWLRGMEPLARSASLRRTSEPILGLARKS
jgi:asparagine synthase (glutamine-hydrolysing)